MESALERLLGPKRWRESGIQELGIEVALDRAETHVPAVRARVDVVPGRSTIENVFAAWTIPHRKLGSGMRDRQGENGGVASPGDLQVSAESIESVSSRRPSRVNEVRVLPCPSRRAGLDHFSRAPAGRRGSRRQPSGLHRQSRLQAQAWSECAKGLVLERRSPSVFAGA